MFVVDNAKKNVCLAVLSGAKQHVSLFIGDVVIVIIFCADLR